MFRLHCTTPKACRKTANCPLTHTAAMLLNMAAFFNERLLQRQWARRKIVSLSTGLLVKNYLFVRVRSWRSRGSSSDGRAVLLPPARLGWAWMGSCCHCSADVFTPALDVTRKSQRLPEVTLSHACVFSEQAASVLPCIVMFYGEEITWILSK